MTKTTDDLDDRPGAREVELEDRVRKLETALEERAAPEATEDAVADRVIAKLSAAASGSRPLAVPDRVLVLASTPDVPPPPKGAVLHPPEVGTEAAGRTWFLTQLVTEFRLAVRMYFDPRYRISRTTQFGIPAIVAILVFNYFVFATLLSIAIVSPILERLLTVFLAVVGYKILTRELVRYREVLEYLTRYGSR